MRSCRILLVIACAGPVCGKLGPEIPDFSARGGESRGRFSAEATLFHSSSHITGPYYFGPHDARNYQLFLDGRLRLGGRVFLEARLPYQVLNRELPQGPPVFYEDIFAPRPTHDWESGFGDFEARLDILVRRWDGDRGGLALVGGMRFPTLDPDFRKVDNLEYYPESIGIGFIAGYRFSKALPGIPVRMDFRNTLRFHPFREAGGKKTGAKLDYVLGLHPVSIHPIEGFEVSLHGTFANRRQEDEYLHGYSRIEDGYNDLGHALKLQPGYAFNARGAFPVRVGTSIPLYSSEESSAGRGWNAFLSFQFRGWARSP